MNDSTPSIELDTNTQTTNTVEDTSGYEKRYKDLQAHSTRVAQENAELRKSMELQKIKTEVSNSTPLVLTDEQKDTLDLLKITDPEEYRISMNKIETDHNLTVSNKVNEATKSAEAEQNLTEMSNSLTEFSKKEGVVLSVETIDLLPKRFTDIQEGLLEKGTITFEEFLVNCNDYLVSNKVVDNLEISKSNFHSLGGTGYVPNIDTSSFNDKYKKSII